MTLFTRKKKKTVQYFDQLEFRTAFRLNLNGFTYKLWSGLLCPAGKLSSGLLCPAGKSSKGLRLKLLNTDLLLLLLLLSYISRVQLCATPWTAAHQAPPSLGFSRQEHWSGLLFPSPMHESEREVTQSCPTPSDPVDCSPPGFSVHGIFQARVLEWGAIAFSRSPHRKVLTLLSHYLHKIYINFCGAWVLGCSYGSSPYCVLSQCLWANHLTTSSPHSLNHRLRLIIVLLLSNGGQRRECLQNIVTGA